MIGKTAIFLKHKAKEFGKWAITKPTKKKIRTGDPMIKTDVYDYNKIIKNPANKFKNEFKYKTRRELLKKKNNIGIQMARGWNKASPLGKAGYAASFVAPKAAFVAGGYFLNNNDNEEE